MIQSFWDTLPRPIFGLAPMDGVTDAAFRMITSRIGRPHLVITEFTSVEGIRAGAERLLDDFLYSEWERPVVAQLFGADPEAFFIGAVVASSLGFDGIDINMGCPAKNITQRGAGAALILDPPRAKQIIQQTKAGNMAWSESGDLEKLGVDPHLVACINERRAKLPLEKQKPRQLPISVKTRIGFAENTILEWASHLIEEDIVNLTIHGRTLKQAYTGFANWDAIGEAARFIHSHSSTLVLGNGDISSLSDAKERASTYGTDGCLIGRAIFGNPWLFLDREATPAERLATALAHARYAQEIFRGNGFIRMRKHLLDYTKGWEGAKELRIQLMRIHTLEDVEAIILPALEHLTQTSAE